MDTREMFVKGIEANEDDEQLRLSYADWLDEQGECEEAERQRNWQTARAWIISLCREAMTYDNRSMDWPTDSFAGYRDLMAEAREAAARDFDVVYCGDHETLTNALRKNTDLFWRNWSTVTGIPLPPNVVKDGVRFYCAC